MARSAIMKPYGVTVSPIIIEDFSDASDWSAGGLTVTNNTDHFKEGTQSVKFAGSTTGSRAEKLNLSPTWDFSHGGVIKIRVYCENLASGGTLRIRMSVNAGGVAGSNTTYFWNRNNLQNGWNELVAHTAEDGTFHPAALAWVFSGTTTDFNTPMQSVALDLTGESVGDFYLDSIEFLPRSRPKIMIGFDSVGENITVEAEPYMTAAGMNGYAAVEGQAFGNAPTNARITTLHGKGWDIIGHTVNHGSIGDQVAFPTEQSIIDEVQPNVDAIAAKGWTGATDHFAYPQGSTSDLAITALSNMGFVMARTGASKSIATSEYGFLNPLWFGGKEMNNGATNTLADLIKHVDFACMYGVAINIFGHNLGLVADALTWTISDFQALIDHIEIRVNQGLIDVVTPTVFYSQLTQPKRSAL